MNMLRRRRLAIGAVLATAVLCAGGLARATAVFDGFVDSMREVCSQQPSTKAMGNIVRPRWSAETSCTPAMPAP